MSITIFVKPEYLINILEVLNALKGLSIDNNYRFDTKNIVFSEAMVSNWIWLNLEVSEYLKLKCKIQELNEKEE